MVLIWTGVQFCLEMSWDGFSLAEKEHFYHRR